VFFFFKDCTIIFLVSRGERLRIVFKIPS